MDELSAWTWKAPPRWVPFIDLNFWQIERRLLQVILVTFFVPFIWANQPHFMVALAQKA